MARDIDELEAEYARQQLEERLQWEKEFIASEIEEGKTEEQARESLAERIKRRRTDDELFEPFRRHFTEWCLLHGWTETQAQQAQSEEERMDQVMFALKGPPPPYAATVKDLELYLSVAAETPAERDTLVLTLLPWFDYRIAPDGLRTNTLISWLLFPMPEYLIENPARTLLRGRGSA